MKDIRINKDQFYLFLILLLAVILRFYHAFDIPFTHDEFSALFRTRFDHFSDLIRGGVLTDTHPAGVQVFLYYWISLVGSGEFIVKLPFLLMGVGAVYLFYKLALLWYNSSVALLSALFLSALAYPLMHSQIARPYISGLFLSLWMVYHWSVYLFKTTTKFNKHLLIYILASVLSAYNHHFSLLFAAIVGFSGLFFILKERILYYALSGLSIFILYIPHLGIFFSQLKKGGVGGSDGWLGTPRSDFLWQYIQYIFNFSSLIIVLVLGIMIIGWRFRRKDLEKKKPFFYLSLTWFLLPFFIAYFYSVNVNPVLQYSVLLFSFPYLFFILFGHIPPLKDHFKIIILALLTPILIYSLVFDRQYYSLFYHSIYKEAINKTREFQEKELDLHPVSLIGFEAKIGDYYLGKTPDSFSYYYLNYFKQRKDIVSFLKSSNAERCSFGFEALSDPIVPELIYDQFPYMVKRSDYYLGSYYEFSKEEGQHIEMYRQRVNLNFESKADGWKFNQKNIVLSDTLSKNKAFRFKEGQEWGLSFEIPFDSLKSHKNDLIDVRLDILSRSEMDELLIVSEIYSDDEKYDWRSTSSLEFYPEADEGDYRLYHCIKLSDLYLSKKSMTLKIYLWNKGKTPILVDNFDIGIRIGNPILYGLMQKIHK